MEIHFEALDRCRTAARTASGDFETLDGDMPNTASKPTESAIFGTVDGASGLASAIDSGWGTLSDELGDAKVKLDGVERALSDVEENVREANRATADPMNT
ncbi:hypothetical protein [Streptosporangium sp. KLBMP 9127]|nr:hypothetical protein [Streptosporangium sp. KLBMP 9127]